MLSESEIYKGARVLKLSGQHPCQNQTIQSEAEEDDNEFELLIISLRLEPAAADISGVHKILGEGKPSCESLYMEKSNCFHE